MHPRNVYKNTISFAQLAKDYPDFAKCLKGSSSLNFHDPESIRQLAKALLKKDFKLEVELPEDRLCPADSMLIKCNRLNYILWLSDLLTDTHTETPASGSSPRKVVGVDIGTGASCIYPLLGTAQFPYWHFLATEIDAESLSIATKNITRNALENRITLISTSSSAIIFPPEVADYEQRLDFTMCNPPFYSSINDMMSSAKKKAVPPLSACTGSTGEMVVDGGEVAFVGKMVDESVHLKEKIRWYTSMLGKRSSVEEVVKKLKEKGVQNYVVGEFVQGVGKTKRWAVGWSFGELRAGDHIARQPHSHTLKSFLPFPTTFKIPLPTDTSISTLLQQVETILKLACTSFPSDSFEWSSVPLHYFSTMYGVVENLYSNGKGETPGNTWSRAARRRAKALAGGAANNPPMEEPPKFGFAVGIFIGQGNQTFPPRSLHHQAEDEEEDKDIPDETDAWDHDFISLPASSVEPEGSGGSYVLLRWTKGVDQVLWESFCGMMRRKVIEELGKLKT
ncbi:hypothetical protein ABW19_dt0201112 [Dactylella cylindrospora]|nr:hypothetical protein ABW19_dt0201112 [Dactylella cylindrospora]